MKDLTAHDRFQERQRIAEEQHIKREMTNLRKAAEMALKVLEEINELSKAPTGLPLPAEIDDAMENLRQALAEQDPVGNAKESA